MSGMTLEEAERKAAQVLDFIRAAVERIKKRCSEEEQLLLEDLWSSAHRYLFLTAWMRANIELGLVQHVAEELPEMLEGGEDDFETYAPSLKKAYEAMLEEERLHARSKLETPM